MCCTAPCGESCADEIGPAVYRVQRGEEVRMPALQGQRDHRLVPPSRPCLQAAGPLPDLRWNKVRYSTLLLYDFVSRQYCTETTVFYGI